MDNENLILSSPAHKVFNTLKRVAYLMPPGVQEGLKRRLDGYRIRHGRFASREPEWAFLDRWIKPGDTVLDIGANVGVYTLRMAELAGVMGRVIAFEPIQRTFRLLTTNAAKLSNVTLFNVAVSDKSRAVKMTLNNYYRAQITEQGERVLSVTIDGLDLPKVSLVKLDVEGHEYPALVGMRKLLERDKPTLIVERNDDRVSEFLSELGYSSHEYSGSPNVVYV